MGSFLGSPVKQDSTILSRMKTVSIAWCAFVPALLLPGCTLSDAPHLLAFKFNQPFAATESSTPAWAFQANADMHAGQVMPLIVVGDVELLASDSSCQRLKTGVSFTEGSTVRTLPGGYALLVFSNGDIMKMSENTEIAVTQFKQAPFDEEAQGAFLRLNKDPSQSFIIIKVQSGTVICEVKKKIYTNESSRFTIQTPIGPISGISEFATIFAVSIARNSAGQLTELAGSCFIGPLSFASDAGLAFDIVEGSQIILNLTTDSTTGLIGGGTFIGAKLPKETSQAAVNAFIDTINAAMSVSNLPVLTPPTMPDGTAPQYSSDEARIDYVITPEESSTKPISRDLPLGPSAPIVLPTSALGKTGDCL